CGHWKGRSQTDARIPLKGAWVCYAIQRCGASKPIIAIQGDPKPRLEIIAYVHFESADRAFRLCVGAGRELITRKEFGVRCKEPGPSIGVKNPISPSPRIAQFGLQCPTVDSVVDKFRGI